MICLGWCFAVCLVVTVAVVMPSGIAWVGIACITGIPLLVAGSRYRRAGGPVALHKGRNGKPVNVFSAPVLPWGVWKQAYDEDEIHDIES